MDATPTRPKPPRRQVRLVVGAIIVLIVGAYAGDALTTRWAEEHPLWLILLNTRNRILILTTNQLDPVTFYLAAGVRLLLSDPLFYLLGHWYGDSAVSWVERRSRSFGEQVRLYEKAFGRFAYPVIFLAPNNLVCMFAGASGMRPALFFTVNVTGTVFRLYLIRRLGDAFETPIDSVLDFFARYRLPLFVLSIALVAYVIIQDRRSGEGEISTMVDLDKDLGAGTAEGQPGERTD